MKYYAISLSQTAGYQTIKEIERKSIKIVDSTTMSICLSLFDWAKYWIAKGGIKAHVSLDEAMMLPEMVNITNAKTSDRRGADGFRYPKDTIVVDDRSYFDTKFFRQRIDDKNHFVCRIKDNALYKALHECDLPKKRPSYFIR